MQDTKRSPAFDESIVALLHDLYSAYGGRLAGTMREGEGSAVTGYNAKGDRQRRFDVRIDEWVREWLIRRCRDGVIPSEEADGVAFGSPDSGCCFVVDPVDGSDNYARGLPLSALSIAVMPRGAPLEPKSVLHALIGDVAPSPPIVASRAMCLVAAGALDAHVDVQRRLTPESFLAASRVVTEAGGHVVRLDGSSPGPFSGLQDGTTLLAAATPGLAKEIIDAIIS